VAERESWVHYFLSETNGKKRMVPFHLIKTQQILLACINEKSDAGTVPGSLRQIPKVTQSPVPHTVTSLRII
jgi:hypothetical protein